MIELIKFGLSVLKKQWIKSFYKGVKLFINKKFKSSNVLDSDYISWVYNLYSNLDYNSIISFKEKNIDNSKLLTINWFIPWVQPGSWGHFNIFRTIKHLDERWHKNNVFIIWEHMHPDSKSIYIMVDRYFMNLWKTEFFLYDKTNIPDSDINIWTSWYSIYFMIIHNNTKKKIYFVQDFEPWFYEKNSKYIFAENTYRFPLKAITAWKYLNLVLKRDYSMICDYYDLWYDEKIYFNKKINFNNKKKRILFYARHVTWRRWFELWIIALSILKRKYPDIEIWFIWWEIYPKIPFEFVNYGILNHNQLSELYNDSIIWVSFSLTNYSLLPCEMMACWLPVVEIKWENTTTVFNNWEWIILSEPNPYDIYENIIKLMTNYNFYNEVQEKWYEFVKDKKWINSHIKIEELLYKI